MVISGGILIWFPTMTTVYHNFTVLAEAHGTIDSFPIERNKVCVVFKETPEYYVTFGY